jgi:hypothetical protein
MTDEFIFSRLDGHPAGGIPHGSTRSGALASTAAGKGADKSADGHRKEDIARHRQMARAHEQAAQCLERGEKESVCQEQLRSACQGVAVGRYCGMRHGH